MVLSHDYEEDSDEDGSDRMRSNMLEDIKEDDNDLKESLTDKLQQFKAKQFQGLQPPRINQDALIRPPPFSSPTQSPMIRPPSINNSINMNTSVTMKNSISMAHDAHRVESLLKN